MQATGNKGSSLIRELIDNQANVESNADPNAVIYDFLDGYYGKAAIPILNYIESMKHC